MDIEFDKLLHGLYDSSGTGSVVDSSALGLNSFWLLRKTEE